MAAEPILTISVIDPITPAIERVKLLLFRPFDIGKWFVIGFCAWLAYLGQGGGGGFNLPGDIFNGGRRGSCPDIHTAVASHLALIITIAVGVGIILIAIGILCLWLSSRGRFMFLHCVAANKAEVAIPWHKYKRQGNSLFVFQLVVGIITSVAIAILAGILVGLGFLMHYNSAPVWMIVVSIVFISLITIIPAIIAIALFMKFTHDFVVPIMFLRGARTVEAWREFWQMLCMNKGSFALYILFQIVIAIAISLLVSLAALTACCACCCTACLWMIPFISTVIILPVLVFKLAYSLNYLRQFGANYDVFAESAA
jgi:hypothetical protein